MKRFYKYIIIMFFVALGIGLIVQFYSKEKMTVDTVSMIPNSSPKQSVQSSGREDINIGQHLNRNSLLGIDKFTFEISREICKQEQTALSAVVDPSLKNLKIGDSVPIDSEVRLNPPEAINWLKKTANSKCSSFRRNNADNFFNELSIDEKNYKSVFVDFERLLEEYRGFTPYRLIRKALDALDRANENEAKSLRDAIVFSLTTYINDASSHVDIAGAMLALKDVKEKSLISYPTTDQIEELKLEYEKVSNEYAKEGQQIHRKYFPTDTDFSNITSERIANILGEEGIRVQLENERKNYEAIRRYAQKLMDLMGKNF